MSATMTDYSRRQLLIPKPSNNKRKERDGLEGFKPSAITTKSLAKPSIHRAPTPANKSSPITAPKLHQPAHNNQLLAGYLAHEFLTKGTFFGEPWDPARAEAFPVSASASLKRKAEPRSEKGEKRLEKQQRYLEVADLLKGGGAHLPGIVNPTELGRFLQL